MPKYVYNFAKNKAEGAKEMKNLLGGKGANLAEMANMGLPVPAGFTITTEVCTYYMKHKESYPRALKKEVLGGLALLVSAFAQGNSCAAAINASKSKPEIFGISIAPAAVVEGFAVFAFAFALVLSARFEA